MKVWSSLKDKWAEFCRGNIEAMVEETFQEYDTDKSGTLSTAEAYPMMQSLYLKMACYTKITSQTVPTRSYVEEVFKIADTDKNGTLDVEEFGKFAKLLCGSLVARITVQMVVQLIVTPLISVIIMNFLSTNVLPFILASETMGWVSYFSFMASGTVGLAGLLGLEVEFLVKSIMVCLVNAIFFPLIMNSLGTLFIYYVCGERELHLKKIS
jgi:hypothetical protein